MNRNWIIVHIDNIEFISSVIIKKAIIAAVIVNMYCDITNTQRILFIQFCKGKIYL